MLRKSCVALATAAALITFTAVEATARGGHGGGHGGGRGGWGGGGHGFSRGFSGGPRVGMGVGRGFAGGPRVGVGRGFAGGYGYRGFAPRYGYRPYVRPYAFRPRFYGGYAAYPYAYYGGVYNDSCYRWRRVWTAYGWQLRRFWVCNYQYY